MADPDEIALSARGANLTQRSAEPVKLPLVNDEPQPPEAEAAAAHAVHRARTRRRAKVRFGLFVLIVIGVAAAVTLGGVLSLNRHDLQRQIDDFGPLAPVVFVVVSGTLGSLFVPGPFLAVLGGALFGPWLGVPLGLAGATLCALIGREIGAHLGRSSAEELSAGRLTRLADWLERYGLSAVIALRLMPATPDAAINYASGLTRLRRWQVGLGTIIGCLPRSLGWGLVGAAIAGGSAWLGTGGGVLIVGTDVVGVIAVVLIARRLKMGPRALWNQLREQRPAT